MWLKISNQNLGRHVFESITVLKGLSGPDFSVKWHQIWLSLKWKNIKMCKKKCLCTKFTHFICCQPLWTSHNMVLFRQTKIWFFFFFWKTKIWFFFFANCSQKILNIQHNIFFWKFYGECQFILLYQKHVNQISLLIKNTDTTNWLLFYLKTLKKINTEKLNDILPLSDTFLMLHLDVCTRARLVPAFQL